MTSKKFRTRPAFSLIEISVVLIIISVFVAGSFVADGLISKFRITAAQNISASSPINDVPDLALWLESSLDSSFNPNEANSGNSLSTWYDQRKSTNKVKISTAGSSPTYSNTINRIHAVEFDGTTNKNFTFDGSFLNKTDYTIFVLEKRKSANSNNYFLGNSGSTSNTSIALGYGADSEVLHSQGSNSYVSGVTSYAKSSNTPRIFAFISNSTSGKKTYINGVLAGQSSDTAQLSGISTLSIGKGYVGEIGEIAIFTRALEPDEIIAIEDYIGKKWSSKINRATSAGCVGYTVTSSGCDTSTPATTASLTSGGPTILEEPSTPTTPMTPMTPTTCAVSVAGVSSTTPVGSGSGTLTCDVTGYSGTSAYTCSDGTLSAAACGCNTAGGYVASGGSCVIPVAACTGGTIDSTSVSGYRVHTFSSPGTFACPTARNVEILVVGGGGGGGNSQAPATGGGGGGGIVHLPSYSVTASRNYTVTVGAGATGASGGQTGNNGSNSSFIGTGISLIGNGGGGGGGSGGANGVNGGSGGGGHWNSPGLGGTATKGSATAGLGAILYGNNGGNNNSNNSGGGGGGGAMSAGGTATGNSSACPGTNEVGGNGGAGLGSSISGTLVYYGAGGGGMACRASNSGIIGGTRGSISAGDASNNTSLSNAVDGTGSGGGGAGHATLSVTSGKGGRGTVIVKYSL